MARHKIHRWGRFTIQKTMLARPWFSTYTSATSRTVLLPGFSILYRFREA